MFHGLAEENDHKRCHGDRSIHNSLSSPDLWDYDEDDPNSDYSSYNTSQVVHS